MYDLLSRLWRLGKPLQWRFLWLMHAKFICGITGVVRDGDGQVLLILNLKEVLGHAIAA